MDFLTFIVVVLSTLWICGAPILNAPHTWSGFRETYKNPLKRVLAFILCGPIAWFIIIAFTLGNDFKFKDWLEK